MKNNYRQKLTYLTLFFLFSTLNTFAQDDLMSILEGESEEKTRYASATFKSTRLVNGHTIEVRPKGILEFVISHRFDRINNGIDQLFGLDNVQARFALEYGLSDRVNIGFGRSSIGKVLDGFFKYKILRQSEGASSSPVSIVAFTSVAIATGPGAFTDPTRDNKFSQRLGYTHQILVGRKLNSNFSLQLMPTLVHRNIVFTADEPNDVLAIGIGGRYKLTNRVAFNAEFYPQLTDNPGRTNALSFGFDIETGGHVFQLHITNSRDMIERRFVAETTGSWGDGDIHIGFNVSRVFNLKPGKK